MMTREEKKKAKKYLERKIKHFEDEYAHRRTQPSLCAYKLLGGLQLGCFEICDYLFSANVITYDEWEMYAERILFGKLLENPIKCDSERCEARTENGFCKFDLRGEDQ